MRKILASSFSAVLLASTAFAGQPAAPAAAKRGSSVGIKPIALRTYADAYANYAGPAHFVVGTASLVRSAEYGTV